MSRPAIGVSSSSVYPSDTATVFETAARLGYDGVEVMVWTDPVSRDAKALRELTERHGIPVLSIHAPTLLLTQRVWGTDPWEKVDRSLELAAETGADTVVLHPPFRWQREYAESFVEGVATRQRGSDVALAVENMFPWRSPGRPGRVDRQDRATPQRHLQVYLPHWDPVAQDYDHVTLDTSHTATSESDAVDMARRLGERLRHVHLADGSGSFKDEHLVPGHGTQPCGEVLEIAAATDSCTAVVVEVGTRRLDEQGRDAALAEALAFARLHLDT